jgi:hypothetical protein
LQPGATPGLISGTKAFIKTLGNNHVVDNTGANTGTPTAVALQ